MRISVTMREREKYFSSLRAFLLYFLQGSTLGSLCNCNCETARAREWSWQTQAYTPCLDPQVFNTALHVNLCQEYSSEDNKLAGTLSL